MKNEFTDREIFENQQSALKKLRLNPTNFKLFLAYISTMGLDHRISDLADDVMMDKKWKGTTAKGFKQYLTNKGVSFYVMDALEEAIAVFEAFNPNTDDIRDFLTVRYDAKPLEEDRADYPTFKQWIQYVAKRAWRQEDICLAMKLAITPDWEDIGDLLPKVNGDYSTTKGLLRLYSAYYEDVDEWRFTHRNVLESTYNVEYENAV